MSEQHEIFLGRQVEAQLASYFADDPQDLQHVTDIGRRLAAVSERPDLPWTYHILRDPSVNAVAAPGGYIFVNQGLLRAVTSDDELAFVLGHETTHIAHHHTAARIERDMGVQIGAILFTAIFLHGNYAAYQVTQITRGLLNASYSRAQELEADHYGVIFAHQAGFDPRAAVSFFEHLQQFERGSAGVGRAFASHPPTADRIAAIQTQLAQMDVSVGVPQTDVQGLNPDHVIQPGIGIGAVRLGMQLGQATAAWGDPKATWPYAGKYTWYSWCGMVTDSNGGHRPVAGTGTCLSIRVDSSGRIDGIGVDEDPSYVLRDGIHTGSPEGDLGTMFGEPDNQLHLNPQDTSDVVWVYNRLAVAFEVMPDGLSGRHVIQIFVISIK
jgi:hypothetical protein